MTAAGHHVSVELGEECCTLLQGYMHLHCIYQVGIFLPLAGARPHAENSVLAMKPDSPTLWDMAGNQVGQAKAEINVGAVR